MDAFLFGVLVIFSIVLMLITFFKKQVIVGIFTGILFVVLGLISWNGIEYVSSTTIVDTSNTITTITNNYSTWHHTFGTSTITYNSVLGTIFLLLGLFLFFLSAVMVFSDRKNNSGIVDDGDGGSDED